MSPVIMAPQRTRNSLSAQPNRQLRRVMLVVFSVALLVRLGPLVWHSALRGNLHTDDGVYFAAAQHLVLGDLPYRDFIFVHPPGVAVALAPFAALGDLIGDANAFAVARLIVITIGAVNAALVAWIAGRQGIVAAIVGGLFYAVWRGAVAAEFTVFLEPFQTLGLLLAAALLTSQARTSKRAVAAGALAGATMAFKIWTAPVLVVLLVWLLSARRVREAGWFVVGCALSVAAIVGPFLALAPRQMSNQVVLDQLNREQSGPGIADRLRLFAGVGHQLEAIVPSVLVIFVAVVAFVGITVLVRGIADGWLWLSILGVEVAVLLLSPSYYDHYPALAAGALAVLIGFAVGRGIELLEGHRTRRPVMIAVAVGMIGLAVSSIIFGDQRANAVNNSALRAFSLQHHCVWSSSPVALIAGQSSRNLENGCDYEIDPFGALLDDKRAADVQGDEYEIGPALFAYQSRTQDELSRSDAVIVDPNNWAFDNSWSEETRDAFLSRFKKVGQIGSLELWSVERP